MTEVVSAFKTPLPWQTVVDFIPKGYALNEQGVFIDRSDYELISKPCWVKALTRSEEGKGWGYVFGWLDQDGNVQRQAFPAYKLTERGTPLAGELASPGMRVVPGKQPEPMACLGSFQLPLDYRRRIVAKLGWLDSTQDNPV